MTTPPGLHRTPAPLLLVRETNPHRDHTRLHGRGQVSITGLIIIGAFVHALTITTGLYLTAYGVWAMATHRRTP